MINIGSIIALIVAILDIFIGYKVWRSNQKQVSNSLFFLLVIQLGFWVVFNALSQSALPPDYILFFVRLVMVVTAGIPVTLYFFSTVFPNKKNSLPSTWQLICFAWAILNIGFNFLPFTFSAIDVTATGFTLVSSWGIIMAALNFLIFGSLACLNFIKSTKHAQGLEKVRLSYLAAAFILTIIVVLVCNFFLVIIFHNNSFTNLGSLLMSVVISGMIGYSLLKIRFTSLDFLLAKIFYYVVMAIWLFAALFFLLNLPRWAGSYTYLLAFIFLLSWAISFVFIYQHLQDFLIKKIVNHGLDWKAENKKFLTRISRELSLNKIIVETLRFISLLIKNEGNLIYEDFTDDGHFFLTSTFSEKKDPKELYELCQKKWQRENNYKPIIFEELHSQDLSENKQILRFMKSEGYGAIFPMILYSGSQGILVLGNKLNRDPYFVQDLELIERSLSEILLMIDRAIIYQNTKNFNDYLQRKVDRATKKLVKANEKLVIADKIKDEFVSVASHELRTPMTAIKNYLWLVNKNNDDGHFIENKKFIQIALDSTDRLIDMVNDMLTISRIEGNRFELNQEKLDLNEIINQVYLDFEPLTHDKHFVFQKKLFKTPLFVNADRAKISEVVQNITGNAIKFTNTGKVVLSCGINDQQQMYISISDTGTGIAEEDFPKLFKKFCRLENSYVKIKETGTGLGLYISKQIMLKHGGDITAVSQFGKGSTFTITFPK